MSTHRTAHGTARVRCSLCSSWGPKVTDEGRKLLWVELQAHAQEAAELAGYRLVSLRHADVGAWLCPGCCEALRGQLGEREAAQ